MKAEELLAALKKQNPKMTLEQLNATLPRGVSAYLVWIGLMYPTVACAMLARMMPTQVEASHKVEHSYKTLEEVTARLRELGLQPQRIYPLIGAPAGVDEAS
jgi:hypothetical protein